MIKLVLVCSAGMSSSMLLQRIKDAANRRNIEIFVDAIPSSSLDDYLDIVEVVLLGPQLAHVQKRVMRELAMHNIAVEMISIKDYSAMDGDVLLDQALRLKENRDPYPE